MNNVLWGALVVTLVVVWWRRGNRPAANRIESPARVGGALQFLLQRGIHGGSVRFQVETESSPAVVFTKYIIAYGDVGLRGRCAQAGAPVERFTALQDELVQRGIPHTLTSSKGEQAIEVHCGRDVGLGVTFVVLTFQRLFETSLGEHCVAFFDRVAIRDASLITGVADAP